MDWKSKNVLVTGSGGFIGSHLTQKLLDMGANVTAFLKSNSKNSIGSLRFLPKNINTNLKIVFGDIRDYPFLTEVLKNQQIVFHLAGSSGIMFSSKHPDEAIEINAIGTMSLLNAAKKHSLERIILASTSGVYGQGQSSPISEMHSLLGQSPYAISKIAAEKIAENYQKFYSLPISIIRPFNTYGPRQTAKAVIPTIIIQALTRKEIKLGNLSPIRDFTFVLDTVAGFITTAECKKAIGQTINIGCDKEISIGDLTNIVVKIIGKNVKVVFEKKRARSQNNEVSRLCSDTQKAYNLLGWRANCSLEEGLRITIQWIEENINSFDIDEYV